MKEQRTYFADVGASLSCQWKIGPMEPKLPPPPRALPLPHFTLPPLAGEGHLFVAALRSHISASPTPTAASLSRFLPGLTPLRLTHLLLLLGPLLAKGIPHDLLAALLPLPPPPLPLAVLLHSLPPRRCNELLASVLPSVSPHAFPDLLHHVLLTARLASTTQSAPAVLALDVLFSSCARNKKLSRATLAYRSMRAHGLLPTVVSCNVFISAALRLRRPEIAVSFFREMRRCRMSPNVYTANMVMRAHCALGRVAEAAQVLDEMSDLGICRTPTSFNTLIATYCKDDGGMELAFRLKKRMEQEGLMPNEVTYNAILHGLCKKGNMCRANQLVGEMRANGVEPNTVTFNTLIHGYVRLGDNESASRVHEEMVKAGVGVDMVTYNALILGLCNEGKVKKAGHLVQELCRTKLEPNASTFMSLIVGQWKRQNSERALDLLNAMKKSGFHPNYDAYKMVVSTFCKNKDFEGALDILKDMLARCMAPEMDLLHEFFEGLSEAKKLHLVEDLRSVANGARFIPDVYYTGDYRNKDKEKNEC
ncbi:pentatricopeptide repeat-containing protein At4g26680, mitochondrial-like [Panicum hallii]|jgi:pentatricopeptide repeat protein|nr:pentatricopeptide repeat-containing protein At4g26680, mitochondrial-like isoform X4 [Panicum hallii]XP_025793817.1 pentatricopeptide repeat-containing protein At4g26680, mitochondrial-like [Panicum hallii]